MDAQYTENTQVALVAPWPLLELNLHKMTSDGSENYSNVFKISRIPKIDYPCIKIGRNSQELWPKQEFAQYPLKNSTKCGETPIRTTKTSQIHQKWWNAPIWWELLMVAINF